MKYVNTCKCVLLTAIVLTLVQTTLQKKHRIIGGQTASRGQIPYCVSLQQNGYHFCGGSIISVTYVISAAHCFPASIYVNKTKVVAGLVNIKNLNSPDAQILFIKKVYIYPGYNSEYNSDDISVLELNKKLVFNEVVQPLRLPTENQRATGDVIVSGWGQFNNDPLLTSDTLQYLFMNLISNEECSPLIKQFDVYDSNITNKQVCALPRKALQASCFGDSGGPAAQSGILIGLVSEGSPTCGQDQKVPTPTLFTRVSSYLAFIKQHVNNIPRKLARFKHGRRH